MQRKHHLLNLNQLRYVNLHGLREKKLPELARGLRLGTRGTFCVYTQTQILAN